ncbi:lipoprotein signal peptidase [Streptomyces tauricus]|uniref:signal peptidase II n=1 Tax=Streptomyces tauricus TaxID=68274 RepID=UPI001677DDA4|nr:signal peptidase II [Streptomyces tauricus]MCW8101123.1 signal peptidase II [Streptomyces tauricus]GHA16231.1 lipoprotein signal peptidase [Streptomyces tauricus]
MAEAERIIGTPDTPGAAGAQPEQPDGSAGPEPERSDRSATPQGASDEAAGTAGASSVSEAPEASGEAAAAPRGRRRIAVLFTVAALAYALDLISKLIVVAKLEHHEPIEIIGDWLKFEAIRNAGAAFGFGEAFTIIFTVIAAAVIVVIARLARKLYSLPWAIALGLLLGGALGNLTDRIFRAPGVLEGAVVDFIAPKHFAVFNLADSAIVCGGILIVLLSFRGLDPDGTVHKD